MARAFSTVPASRSTRRARTCSCSTASTSAGGCSVGRQVGRTAGSESASRSTSAKGIVHSPGFLFTPGARTPGSAVVSAAWPSQRTACSRHTAPAYLFRDQPAAEGRSQARPDRARVQRSLLLGRVRLGQPGVDRLPGQLDVLLEGRQPPLLVEHVVEAARRAAALFGGERLDDFFGVGRTDAQRPGG